MTRIRHRRTRLLVAVVAALGIVAALGAPVLAGAPQRVTIVSNVTFNPNGPNFGDFTATGPAVVSGVICATGTFVDIGLKFQGFESNRGMVQLQVIKEFTCDDGSGTFVVKLQIQANFDTGIESFSWVVLGGTGDHSALRGAGRGSTVPTDTGNINTYSGFLLD